MIDLQVVEKSCLQAGQKDLRGEAREISTSGGVLRRYVGATPLGAGMIPAALERNYPKRLLKAGWWHMSLFQQPARLETVQALRIVSQNLLNRALAQVATAL